MIAAVGRIGRHQIGDVAHHEQLARPGVEDHLRRDPGIAAADHHGLGRLAALGEVAVAALLGREPAGPEGAVAVEQPLAEGLIALAVLLCSVAANRLRMARNGAPVDYKLNARGMPMSIRPRRSVLYMPGSNARAIEKARTLPADAVILDLEDSVAPDAKADAREQVRGGDHGRRLRRARGRGPRQRPRHRVVARRRRHGRTTCAPTRSWCRRFRSPITLENLADRLIDIGADHRSGSGR